MLKRILIALTLAISILYIVDLESSALQSVNQQQNQSENTSDNEYCSALCFTVLNGLRDFSISVGHLLKEYREEIIAIGTVILAFATGFLWNATKDLVKGAEDTASRQLRAYVFLKDLSVENVASGRSTDLVHRIFVHWVNTGKTPTKRLRWNINFAKFNPDIPDSWRFPDSKHNNGYGLLGPGQQSRDISIALPADELNSSVKLNWPFYVWGWVEYSDVFEKSSRHRTEFCVLLEIDGDPSTTNCFFRLATHSKHNGADEDCMKPPATA